MSCYHWRYDAGSVLLHLRNSLAAARIILSKTGALGRLLACAEQICLLVGTISLLSPRVHCTACSARLAFLTLVVRVHGASGQCACLPVRDRKPPLPRLPRLGFDHDSNSASNRIGPCVNSSRAKADSWRTSGQPLYHCSNIDRPFLVCRNFCKAP